MQDSSMCVVFILACCCISFSNAVVCSDIILSGQAADQPQSQFMGQYTLEFGGHDGRSVFKMKPTRCDREPTPGSNGKEFLLKCERTIKNPAFMFFDQQRGLWEVSMHGLGSPHVNLVAASRVQLPTQIEPGSWHAADNKGGWTNAPLIRATCKAAEQTEFFRYHIPHKNLNHPLDIKKDSQCHGWKATGGCNPDGPREVENDRPCHDTIKPEWEGFCECSLGRREKFACGHEELTCSQVCVIKFPMVLAESEEDWSSNQMARNLVTAKGSWLSPTSTNQWVVFDLGQSCPVQQIQMNLDGTAANPKDCILQSSTLPSGPWHDQVHFTAQAKTKEFGQAVNYAARYWRLYINTNWGASWGVSLKEMKFRCADGFVGASTAVAMQTQDVAPQQTDPYAKASSLNSVSSGNMLVFAVIAAFAFLAWKQSEGSGNGVGYQAVRPLDDLA